MQLTAGVWIGKSNLLIQFDSQTWLRWRDNEATLELDRRFHEIGMKTLPSLNSFKNQKVGRTRRQLNVGSGNNRTAI